MTENSPAPAAPSSKLSPTDYNIAFGISQNCIDESTAHDRHKAALSHALDIRKFEISLYWTRTAYFWTFNTLVFGAYGALQTVTLSASVTARLSTLVCCLGLLCSYAWHCANRGSKQWQENWENHVDLLEDKITGPLYKVVVKRPSPTGWMKRAELVLTGPAPFSVSRVNQIISVYVTLLWIGLLADSTIFGTGDWRSWTTVGLTLAACIAIRYLGRTHEGPNENEARQRQSGLV